MDALLIATRTLHFAAAASLEGIYAFWCFVAAPAFRSAGSPNALEGKLEKPLTILAWASVVAGVATGVAWLFIVASQMSSLPLTSIVPRGVLGIVLTRTQFGTDWRLRGLLCVVLVLGLGIQARVWKQPLRWLGLFLSSALIGSLAWAGHGGAAEDVPFDALHLPADVLHLLATGAWLGALYPLALLLGAALREEGLEVARVATLRFSTLGITCVGTLLVTGLVNTWFLAGTIPALIGTAYGLLLLLKVALFAVMIAIARVNRNRLMPFLERTASDASLRQAAIRRLGRNVTIEASAGFLVLAIVGIIGILPPGLHTEPNWPLPFRFDFQEMTGVAQIVFDVAAVLCGICLAVVALAAEKQRYRGMSLALAALAIFGLAGWIALQPGIVRAYPTSYYASTQPYAAPSIGRGAPLYASNCTACHGTSGRGDGPLAARLPIRPADLTEEHIFAHSTGDLYWWISHGGDRGVMPGFESALTSDQRWDLINFVLARAAGKESQVAGARVTADAAPLPDFAYETSGVQNTLTQTLKTGPGLLVLFVSPAPLKRLEQLKALQTRLTAAGLRVIAVELDKPNLDRSESLPLASDVSDDVRAALALFRARTDGGVTELMLDRGGGVRARWTKSGPGGLADPAALITAAQRVASIAVAPQSHAGHAH